MWVVLIGLKNFRGAQRLRKGSLNERKVSENRNILPQQRVLRFFRASIIGANLLRPPESQFRAAIQGTLLGALRPHCFYQPVFARGLFQVSLALRRAVLSVIPLPASDEVPLLRARQHPSQQAGARPLLW